MKAEIVSYSEIETYRQCRLKHQLSYIEKWRTAGDEAEALARGTLFHTVMENHYRMIHEVGRGEVTAEDLTLAVMPFLAEEGTGAQSERQELVEWIYRGYVELYGLDDHWEIIGVETPFMEPLRWPNGEESGFMLAGTIDLTVRDHSADGGIYIVDHKTCKNLPKQKDFDMEDQTGIYAFLRRAAGDDIRGAIYNHCRTWKLQRPMEMGERFMRTLTVRTDRELETMAVEALEVMAEAYEAHGRRSAGGNLYDAPRTPDGERCGWKCGFTEACIAGRKYGPERTRQFLEDIGYKRHETKPGPTFNKEAV